MEENGDTGCGACAGCCSCRPTGYARGRIGRKTGRSRSRTEGRSTRSSCTASRGTQTCS